MGYYFSTTIHYNVIWDSKSIIKKCFIKLLHLELRYYQYNL